MKYLSKSLMLSIILIFSCLGIIRAQTTIRGEIRDAANKEGLANATVILKGTTEGTVADLEGKFELSTAQKLPFTLLVSYVGYTDKELIVTAANQKILIELSEDAVTIDQVEVKGRRISEKKTQSALTMETLDAIAITETPAANFYDGLGSLKEVDLTAASLGFKIINTRGFNSTSPVRSLQIIDGVDNQSPGLNFSLGNFLGASELDVNNVTLIVGASSAFYGPNAFNGVVSMQTKSPFLHKGLKVMVKGGERNLFEAGIRWADAFKNKSGKESVAYKFNISGFRANDWIADNYDPVDGTPSSTSNPGGYDAVNIYGDEYLLSNDFTNSFSLPGMGIIHRKGYREIDIVDYDSENLKVAGAVHFRLNPAKDYNSPELVFGSNYSTGTTVYQGDNRYSLRDIQFFQHKVELKQTDKYFLRFYVTHEDAGNSYDPYFTALQLQQNAKEDIKWASDYINFWQTTINPRVRKIEGYPNPIDYLGRPEDFRAAQGLFLNNSRVMDSLALYHSLAQTQVLKGNPLFESVDFFEPGTERFNQEFNSIITRLGYTEGGTRFYDRSALYHMHGEYKFNDLIKADKGGAVTDLDLLVGANYRLYTPNSKGSILLDTGTVNIDTYEYGIYGGGTMELNKRLKISGSVRLDKNKNFNYLVSPAASLVYTPNRDQVLRFSFSSAIRNPTLADQYLFYNVGRAILIGNLNGFNNLLTIESLREYLNTRDQSLLDYFDVAPIRPEQVRTIEAGYRNTFFDKLYVDATYYYSFYQDFIGYNIGVDAAFEPLTGSPTRVQAYRVAANAVDRVTTQGFSLGSSYYFGQNYVLNGNYSFNQLNTLSDDPIIPAFNTPKHKYNIGISGRDLAVNFLGLKFPDFGFNVNYKWIEGFIFEGSPQFTGIIPSYNMLDAQVNWQVKTINTTFKLGASNLLNNMTFQTYGGPRIGRLAYLSMVYDWNKK
ncbi:MAG: TonB-dependent receptor [Haliscomenobacter sp.]|nr:TonB-dependent receptor [Haliscomenobacter sp.]MBK9491253.1 TonB-dependent receptor [Haliscomenobacter sp.]